MTRIFATWQKEVVLTPETVHHVVNVLRMRVGESLELLMDEQVYLGKITSLKPLKITRLSPIKSTHELPFFLTLIYPVSKGERMDWVVQKASELGVLELIPCQSEHSVVHWQAEDVEKKLTRYQRMIEEATLQSKREVIMKMRRYLSLKEALLLPYDHRFIASEYHQHLPLNQNKRIDHQQTVSMLVGPEGGFSQDEIALAIRQGYQPFSLGPSILRTETAVITALSMVRTLGIDYGK